MSICLRIILLAGALLSCIYVIHKIRKSQMKIDGAMYWIFFAFLILILSILPGIGIWLAEWMKVESPVNLVFLVIIFLVLWKLFSFSVKISQLENKLNILTEEIAIWRKHVEENLDSSTIFSDGDKRD